MVMDFKELSEVKDKLRKLKDAVQRRDDCKESPRFEN